MTITRQLLILLLVEVTLLGGIAHLVIGLSPLLSLLFVVLALLGLRCLVVLLTWGFSRFYPVPAIGLRAWLHMVIREMFAYLLTFTWLLPFERLLMAPDRLTPSPLPLLLVHGYGCSRGIWRLQRTRLEAAGHVVATVTLTPPFGHLDDMVPLLARRIDEVLAATGAAQLVLIGHSMGGLVCRDYLALAGGGKVTQLITLATPHQGSQLAALGLGDNAREMEPGSGWLQRFAAVPLCVPGISVRTSHDNFVLPQSRQRMEGMEDIELAALGHLSLIYSRRTTALLLTLLARSLPQTKRA
ncbi:MULTISPECIES: esterase/lipase family protein [Aeromonas]|uniref:Alpha/beta fold hydrolase n=1 Tax=Aeromonas bestiarum TaxID=105751 RepID=A0ABT7PY42_9GAMM|nr:alpha/beta fold hydrolase [Aeromonas bestiarum]MDM5072014.1 alpha/beta fold hydrolase [Aeromonas bestiarum]